MSHAHIRAEVRQVLQEAGWLVTSKDAIKFGADYLLYSKNKIHSEFAVSIVEEENCQLLNLQRFARLCESVHKRALFVILKRHEDGHLAISEYAEVSRWNTHIN